MPPEFESLVEENETFMEDSADTLANSFNDAAPGLAAAIIRALHPFATKDFIGKDIKDLAAITAQVEKTVKAYLSKAQDGALNSYLSDFDTIMKNVLEVNSLVNNVDVLQNRFTAITTELKSQARGILIGDTDLIRGIQTEIVNAVIRQESLTSLEKTLTTILRGGNGLTGLLEHHTQQYARDILFQANGALNNAIAESINANAYRYVGSIKPGVYKKLKTGGRSKTLTGESRPQCKRWVKMEIIKLSELQAEINWAFSNGSGMINGTNTQNFTTYRGGWNCRHSVYPIVL
jgi:hypothetical protein